MSPTSMPLTSYSSETLRAKKISELLVINFVQALRCKTQIFVMGYLQFLHGISERFDNYFVSFERTTLRKHCRNYHASKFSEITLPMGSSPEW